MKNFPNSFLYFTVFFLFINTIFAQKTIEIDSSEYERAQNYIVKGYYLEKDYKRDSAYYFYSRAKDIFLIFEDSLRIGDSYMRMALVESDLGDYSNSDVSAVSALKYLNEDNSNYLSTIYNCLAISSRKQYDFNEAVYWYDKAIKISKKTSNKIVYLQNKANTLRDLKDYDQSIKILDSLNKVGIENAKTKARVLDNLAYTKWLNGEKHTILEDLNEALSIRHSLNDYFGLIASYSHLSDYYKESSRKLSINYAEKMYKVAYDQKSPQDQLEALSKLIEVDYSSNSKKHYSNYTRINDSLSKVELQTKNKFGKLKFDSEKNREENYKLKITNSEKEVELQKRRTYNLIGGISTGFGLVLFSMFLYHKNQKHKQEKRAEVYKTETRIAKKIHDEVANNVVNIMNKVQYSDESKEVLLDDLEKVYLLTRNISHQNNQIETGEKFTGSLNGLITSFNSSSTTIILKNIQKVELDELAENKQIEIYRVIQELLVNMQKHSKAKLVALAFEKNKKDYSIKFSDNGVGVDLNNLKIKNGLSNVESRIKSINGSITFESSKNNGFKAFINFKQ